MKTGKETRFLVDQELFGETIALMMLVEDGDIGLFEVELDEKWD